MASVRNLSSFYWLYFTTKWKYKVKGILKCGSRNIIYLISCSCCGMQYGGSATVFAEWFRFHKSDLNAGKVRCGVANHLITVCHSSTCNFYMYQQVQLIENVSVENDDNIKKVF